MVLGLLTAALCLASDDRPLDPADLVLRASLPGIPAAVEAHSSTALSRLLADEELHAALGPLFDAEAWDPRQITDELLRRPIEGSAFTWGDLLRSMHAVTLEIYTAGGADGLLRLLSDLRGIADTERALKQLAKDVRAHRHRTGALPGSLAEVGSPSTDAWGTPYLYARSTDGAGFDLRSAGLDRAPGGTGSGADIHVGEGTGSIEHALFVEQTRLVLTVRWDSADTVESVWTELDAAAKQRGLSLEEPAAGSGAARDGLRVVGGAPFPLRVLRSGASLAFLAGAFDAGPVAEGLRQEGPHAQAPKQLGSEGVTVAQSDLRGGLGSLLALQVPAVAPLLDALEASGGPFVSTLLRGGEWRLAVDDGLFLSESVTTPDSSTRPGGPSALSEADRTLVHPDALLGWLSPFDPSQAGDAVASLVASLDLGPVVERFESEHGLHIERDLFAALGTAFAVSVPPPRSLLSVPDIQLAAPLVDAEGFVVALDALGDAMRAECPDQIRIEKATYQDVRLYTISLNLPEIGRLGLPFDPTVLLRPTVAVLDDRMIATTLPSHAKREIRRRKRNPDDANPILADRRVPDGALGVSFADWANLLGGVYSSARALAPMLAMGMDLPFDPTKLPDVKRYTGLFGPTVQWQQWSKAGARSVATSSWGPDVLLLAAVAYATWTLRSADEAALDVELSRPDTPVAPTEPAVDSRLTETKDALDRMRVALEVFRLDRGSYPASLEELSAPSESFPNGFLDGKPVGRDGWGNPFRYSAADGQYRLWSSGPNGTDEGAEGDDVEGSPDRGR